jgi:hypothetical protein
MPVRYAPRPATTWPDVDDDAVTNRDPADDDRPSGEHIRDTSRDVP